MFIEVKQGIFVKAEEIEAVLDVSDKKDGSILSKVYISGNGYPSILSSRTIIDMVKRSEKGSAETQALNILKQQSNFAG